MCDGVISGDGVISVIGVVVIGGVVIGVHTNDVLHCDGCGHIHRLDNIRRLNLA